MTEATWQMLPELKVRLLELDARRRPDYFRALAVALLLADKYRDKRGYTDETVGQISAAVSMPENSVRTSLAALELLGYWERVGKGNQHTGTRRRPTFLEVSTDGTPAIEDDEHRGADPDSLPHEHRGADPTEHEGEHRGVDDGASWGSAPSIVGYDPQHRGADPTPPLYIPCVTTPLEREVPAIVEDRAEALVATNTQEVGSLVRGLIQTYGVLDVEEAVDDLVNAGVSFSFPSQLVKAIEAKCEKTTAQILDALCAEDSFDPADWEPTPPPEPPAPSFDTYEDDEGRLISKPANPENPAAAREALQRARARAREATG